MLEKLDEEVDELKAEIAERDLAKVRSAQLATNLDGIIGEGTDIGPVRLWAFEAPAGTSADDLRELLAKARGRVREDIPVVAVGAAVNDGKVSLVVAASPQSVALGLSAGELLKAGLPAIGGRGGGKAEFAQGGGSEAGGIAAAFAAIAALIGERAGSREE